MVTGELSEQEFEKLKKGDTDLEAEQQRKEEVFNTSYKNIIDILKEYLDIKEEYYNIIALWIMGTYFHEKFPSYPFLYFNAMKGSGKSRAINLITTLSKDGEILNALTEAVLFRTKGTLAIDEFEGVTRKGAENLRELLNSAYKKGTKVKRMKQAKTDKGIEMVVEEFEVYRPIVLANIWGMENVLGDRCISLVLERSNKVEVTNLIEIFNEEKIVKETLELLKECSLCRCSFSAEAYKMWNTFIKGNNTYYTYYTNNTNYTNYTELFKTIKSMDLSGRELELSMPLCLVASEISDDVLKKTTFTLKSLFSDKKEDEITENTDISLYDFLSQQLELSESFQSINGLTNKFKEFLGSDDPEVNPKWFGRALKRLNLVIEKRRKGHGTFVKINYNKAKEKIKMFK